MRICEIFRSLQGEGLMMGAPTVFIRTVGCNLRCAWCDTDYAFDGGEEMDVETVVGKVGRTVNVCVTGGEPMLQRDMPELLDILLSMGKKVVLETNGSVDLSALPRNGNLMISMDVKCPSSGMEDRMEFRNLSLLDTKDQLKFIVADNCDFDYALEILKKYPTRTNVIFCPVGGTERLEWLAERVLASGLDARVLPQLHKIIWGDKRSV
ncbi:MAG: radical SAM protein [Candidatus Methanomethylophilaceae archaeon]|nr:radical SAM protein [Candidatus Methanomethylophilaceae archaeon]